MNKICIVGDILNDITLKTEQTPLKMRLGGIIHAARGLWAMGIEYSIAYFAPSYLDEHINSYLKEINCTEIIKLGDVTTCPYTILIQDVKEVGDQGYEFILRDNIQINYYEKEIVKLNNFNALFFVSGNYDYNSINSYVNKEINIHLDLANNVNDIKFLLKTNKLKTIFISTSSYLFKSFYNFNTENFSINGFFNQFKDYTDKIILKENRGGSRAYCFKERKILNIPSQTQEIVHSVGVGDVYDISYIALSEKCDFYESLIYSSWIATEYAKTTFPDDFRKMVSRILKIESKEIISLGGCLIPWEMRNSCQIYIAAPDFDFVDTKPIDFLEQALLYHNFKPHRPIKENGQMEANATNERKQEIFENDMELLDKCNMLIAVLLYNDPGTLIEIGIASQRNMPTFVYDPYNIAKNCMLTQIPTLITSNVDELISEVFNSYSKILN